MKFNFTRKIQMGAEVKEIQYTFEQDPERFQTFHVGGFNSSVEASMFVNLLNLRLKSPDQQFELANAWAKTSFRKSPKFIHCRFHAEKGSIEIQIPPVVLGVLATRI